MAQRRHIWDLGVWTGAPAYMRGLCSAGQDDKGRGSGSKSWGWAFFASPLPRQNPKESEKSRCETGLPA